MTKLSARRQRTKDLTDAVKRYCWAHGGYCFRTSNMPRIINGAPVYVDKMSIGMPDLISVMPNGVTLFIEVKVSPDEMRESQLAFQQEMLKRGHAYIIVHDTIDSLVEAIEILEQYTAPTGMLGDAQGRATR